MVQDLSRRECCKPRGLKEGQWLWSQGAGAHAGEAAAEVGWAEHAGPRMPWDRVLPSSYGPGEATCGLKQPVM